VCRVVYLVMFFRKPKKSLLLLGLVLLAGQGLGLIFCGDIACLQGSSDENCATLVCSLLSKHSAPISPSDSSQNNFCQCFCHTLIDLPTTILRAASRAAAPLSASVAQHFFSEPIRDIDHPPVAELC
ncbi:MAG: hypothetical protein ONA90_10520, partial [candidate division KSB1 bacterium]|nr:hypothetical protein [candidate division KSB1 bacterium]